MTLSELTELIEQTDDPEVAQTLIDEYNRTHSEPWDQWDPEHAENMLIIVLDEWMQAEYERCLVLNASAHARMAEIVDRLEAAEGDMPSWRNLCRELRSVLLDGLTVPVSAETASRIHAARADAMAWYNHHRTHRAATP